MTNRQQIEQHINTLIDRVRRADEQATLLDARIAELAKRSSDSAVAERYQKERERELVRDRAERLTGEIATLRAALWSVPS